MMILGTEISGYRDIGVYESKLVPKDHSPSYNIWNIIIEIYCTIYYVMFQIIVNVCIYLTIKLQCGAGGGRGKCSNCYCNIFKGRPL